MAWGIGVLGRGVFLHGHYLGWELHFVYLIFV